MKKIVPDKNLPAVTVIITVLNEAKNVESLVKALAKQIKLPREVIIVDGGSSDETLVKLKKLSFQYSKLNLKIAQQVGNRSVGRNKAITLSKTEWLAITDAGCIPDKNWLAELFNMQKKTNALIVGGYFYGLTKTGFQQAVTAYALTMPRLIVNNFLLPTTRSMLIQRKVLEALAGFNEKLADNEDYVLACQLVRKGYRQRMAFAPRAKVGWLPPSTWSKFVKTIYRFARGDTYAGIWRPKVILIFARYLVALVLLLFGLVYQSDFLLSLLTLSFFLYCLWAIIKNYSSAKKGWYYLPLFQITSDLTVMSGSLVGYLKRLTRT